MSRMRVKRLIKLENCSLSLDKEFILPFNRIDIFNGFGTIKILKVDNKNDRIMIYGLVNIHIAYKIEGMELGIQTFSMPLEFSHSCILEEYEGGVYPNIKEEIEKVKIKVKDNGKIKVCVGVNLEIKVFKVEEILFLAGETADHRVSKSLININEILSIEDSQITINECIPLADIKTLPKKVIDVSGRMYITKKFISKKDIQLKGIIELSIICEDIGCNQLLVNFKYLQEFNKVIIVENLWEGLLVYVDYDNPKIKVGKLSTQGLDLTITSDIRVYLSKLKVMRLINEITEEIRDIKVSSLLTEYPLIQRKERLHIQKAAYLQGSEPLIKKLLLGFIKHCYISKVIVKKGTIYIKGSLKLHIEYLGYEDGNLIHYFSTFLNFNSQLNIEEDLKSINIEAEAIIENESLEIIQQGAGIQVLVDLKLTVKISKLVEKEFKNLKIINKSE